VTRRTVAASVLVLIVVAGAGCDVGDRVGEPGVGVDLDARTLAGGADHTCAVVGDDGRVACWGEDTFGQLGDGRPSPRHGPPVEVTGLAEIRDVTSGYDHTCALDRGGSVACWGLDLSGQLGDGTDGDISPSPVPVGAVSGVTELAAGQHHTCARRQAGSVACWGENGAGELGDGTTENRLQPVPVEGLTEVTAIAAGGHHTCAVAARRLHCWGYNGLGQLGDGTRTDRTEPVLVAGLEGVVEVTAGADFTCATTEDGSVHCWGGNEYGQLGDGTRIDRVRPTIVAGIGGATALSAHGGHVCALAGDGDVLCWGDGAAGQGGDGSGADRTEARRVPVDEAVVAVSTTDGGACALTAQGAVVCWGRDMPADGEP
jgi:alpha-tubulin suppressor-like RCC1 family protein